MSHTALPLTYCREYDGENWLLAVVDFGPNDEQTEQIRWCITTDHVHASEADFGEPEDDVRLWAAAPLMYEALAADERMEAHATACTLCTETVRCDERTRLAARYDGIRKAALAQARGEAQP